MRLRDILEEITEGELFNTAVSDLGVEGEVPSEEQKSNIKTLLILFARALNNVNDQFPFSFRLAEIPYQTMPFNFELKNLTEQVPDGIGGINIVSYESGGILQVITNSGGRVDTRGNIGLSVGLTPVSDLRYVVNGHSNGSFIPSVFPLKVYHKKLFSKFNSSDLNIDIEIPHMLKELVIADVANRMSLLMSSGEDSNRFGFKQVYQGILNKVKLSYTKVDFAANASKFRQRGFK